MTDVNLELWKIGIPSKTQHNEVAPNQFELAPIFGFSNVATDHNQMVMQTLKRVAKHHGLECLLHEKPFKGVNGSGKHNNWSMGTDDGLNLLNPGSTPCENLSFLVFVAAVIKAVDTYAPLLRLAAANAGNDHRLGANEAPPAIISIFFGDQLQDIFESVATGKPLAHGSNGRLELGVNTLPKLPQDLTDRNRTSPFAFTGNKFEFRMCPSSDSISGPNFVINTIVAEVLDDIAGTLEKAKDLNKAAHDLIVDVWKKHSKVIFNGNGYTDEWVKEAEKRGLPNLRSSVEAWPYFASDESVRIFTKHKIFTKEEIHARLDIVLEKYSKQINIEAACAHEIATREILPACTEYAVELASQIAVLEEAGMKALSLKKKLSDITALVEEASALADELEKARLGAHTVDGCLKEAEYYRDQVFSKAEALRVPVDMLEKLMPKDFWPMPTYEDLLFKI